MAFNWLTVLPLPQPRTAPDRAAGAGAIAAAPVVGLALGGAVAGLAAALVHTDLPAIAVGTLMVAALALTTRGMHLDGLADTVDGLGCYGSPKRAREVMRSGSVGPFGAAALTMILLVQVVLFAALATDHRWVAIAAAVTVSRCAVVAACRTGLQPIPGGFGALVVGTQRAAIVGWGLAALFAGLLVSDQWWRGPAAVALVAGWTWLITRHCARRFEGINGDVLGFVVETSCAAALLVLVA
ncbi:adenosylcobinamide-GDP ribazoletransferase [Williamsia sp. CHRR-6]|nr:adenosylcobinamide-GDP ribazoletransferase [Williamsia sp. CHRR-6]